MAPRKLQPPSQSMTTLERLALGIGVWIVLTSIVFLMGWL